MPNIFESSDVGALGLSLKTTPNNLLLPIDSIVSLSIFLVVVPYGTTKIIKSHNSTKIRVSADSFIGVMMKKILNWLNNCQLTKKKMQNMSC